ncbi:MAG: ribosome biosis GTPase / thiamine phosphate phosphatase, partial [Ilumatobacteraceae bacterium]
LLGLAVGLGEVGVVVGLQRSADRGQSDQQRQPDGEHHEPSLTKTKASNASKHFWTPPISIDALRVAGGCLVPDATLSTIDERCDIRLGWSEELDASWQATGLSELPGRVTRLDRGWSTVLRNLDEEPLRMRNIGAEVAVGDWVVPSVELDRVEVVLPRRSAFVRRASFEGSRAESQTIAANIDVVMLVHALTSPPNQRRLERELVLAWDSGARPVVVLTKRDLVDDPAASVESLHAAAPGVTILTASGISGEGVDTLAGFAAGNATIALLGASGVGKSTLINALVGNRAQATAAVREGDGRGRHTTVATELVRLPGGGWLIDTPGVRAVSLWSSGHGIERAFADVFDLMDHCRFRDCKHEDEPGCAVQAAIAAGTLDPLRLASMKRLVAEELALEEEQRAQLKAQDRRGVRKIRVK